MDAPHAIVIGGGFAGLAAAFRLRERGLRVTLLEQQEEPGGRARSRAANGFTFDAGAQVLAAAAPTFEALARAAGAADSLLPLRPLASLRRSAGFHLRLPADHGSPRRATWSSCWPAWMTASSPSRC